MKRVLITGISGQDGSYLTELLLSKGYDVHGLVRHTVVPPSHVQLHSGDLSDSNSLLRVLMEVRPDEIYNLGAQSHVATSFEMPEHTGDVTGIGVTRLLEAIRTTGLPCRFFQASSSELFGESGGSTAHVSTPFAPRSPYACAKVYAFHMTRNYRESYGFFAVNGVLFGHESPRRSPSFVSRKITRGVADMLRSSDACLTLGNIDAEREWGYAKDFVEGMWRMLQQDRPDDVILATGTSHPVRSFLEACLTRAGIRWQRRGLGDDETYIDEAGRVIVRIDPTLKRPGDGKRPRGDTLKAKEVLGWEAKTTLAELADIMLTAECEALGMQI